MDNLLRVYRMPFAVVYPLYVKKVVRKGRTQAEVDLIITWLTGYDQVALGRVLEANIDFETFFNRAPQMNANVTKITGLICGYRVEEIEDTILRQVRYLDKLIDELAKGKALEKILRV